MSPKLHQIKISNLEGNVKAIFTYRGCLEPYTFLCYTPQELFQLCNILPPLL